MRKILILVLGILLTASMAYAQPAGNNMGMRNNVKHADFTADGTIVKATPGIFYGISGFATTIATKVLVANDGDNSDTTDIIWIGGTGVDENGFGASYPNGILCSDGISVEVDVGGGVFVVYYE